MLPSPTGLLGIIRHTHNSTFASFDVFIGNKGQVESSEIDLYSFVPAGWSLPPPQLWASLPSVLLDPLEDKQQISQIYKQIC